MNKIRRISCLLILMTGLFFMWGGSCKAWGPQKPENAESFSKWYEENKNNDGAVYHLSGDLKLTKGTKDSPIVWDGQGTVTIDCGGYSILVDSNLLINNPNLKILGKNFFVIMVRTDGVLTLEQGTVDFEGEDGTIVQVMNGNLVSPQPGNRFHITGHGNNVTGLQYETPKEEKLSNLDISIEGNDSAIGIGTSQLSGFEIENCTVTANGGTSAYGILGSGKTNFLLRQSNIMAAVSKENGEAHSVFSSEGKIKSEASVLVPEVSGAVTYQLTAMQGQMPVYVNPGDSPESWQLPSEVKMIVTECGSKKESVLPVPVVWNPPVSGMEKPGYKVVKGSFQLQTSEQNLVNPDNVVPEVTVISLPPEKMFLISYKTFNDEVQGVKVVIPYPYGAESLKIEYSLDNGKTFRLYKSAGSDNLMCAENPWMVKGLFSLYLDLPVRDQAVKLRTIVKGNSLFNGTSAVWTIGKDKETEEAPNKVPDTSDDINDDQGGDRGGQDSDPVFPEQEKPDVPHLGAEAPETEQNVTENGKPQAEQTEGGASYREENNAAAEDNGTDKAKTNAVKYTEKAKLTETSAHAIKNTKAKTHTEAAKLTEKTGGSNWLLFLAVLLGIAVIAAGGIWCGIKVFKK